MAEGLSGRHVPLGHSGIETARVGLGCMGIAEFYGARDDDAALKMLDRAFELGVTFYDTADVYGRGHSEHLVGKFMQGKRDDVVICTKFGIVRDPEGPDGSLYDRSIDNSPAYMRAACEASLRRLGTDRIDLYYVHRVDPEVPIEDTVGALSQLVAEGKIRAIGLSEVSEEVLRRAHAVHPVAALQSEYSLWTREHEADVLPACRELGVAFIAYCPLGRGFLTGSLDMTALASNDLRLASPRLQGENWERNKLLLEEVGRIAKARGCTLPQVALAWLLAQGDEVIPIPGTKRIRYLQENVAALSVRLTDDDVRAIGDVMAPDRIAGSRNWIPEEAPR